MKKIICTVYFLISVVWHINGQENDFGPVNAGVANFLNITPDARSAAMGGVGLTLPNDGNAVFHNGAAILLHDTYNKNDVTVKPNRTRAAMFFKDASRIGISYNYTPWMREYKSGYALHAMGGFYKINNKHAVFAGFRYYNYPKSEMLYKDNENTETIDPGEFAIDLGYAYKVMQYLTLSATLRYIRSDMGNLGGAQAANAVAFDVSALYKQEFDLFKNAYWAAGFQLINVGTKIKYMDKKESIPAAAKLGGSVSLPFTDMHKLLVATDFKYRLSPLDVQTLGISIGTEYTFIDHFMLRGGYHYGEKVKADFSYATAGVGIQYWGGQIDFSWLFGGKENPWRNTFQISLGYSF